ncbi:cyclic nucleotide-binding/CBS domain-containing protein [Actinophytocola sp.]|uniref:CBS domain-containing protein n=1 Tax=Actinophytocola sp. TaxID=1872138 RepID=UPI002ED92040
MKVGDLVGAEIVSVEPADSLRTAAEVMVHAGVGSAVVLTGGVLSGILTERDLLKAVAEASDLDHTPAAALMTREVVTVEPDWEIYEAAAEMAAHRIRHLVVTEDGRVTGVVSVRDVLLAGQRIALAGGEWAVLRDPLTFSIRERRKLQRCLLGARGTPDAEQDLGDLLGLLLGSWSLRLPLPPDAATLKALSTQDRAALREAVLAELPELQRAVHPSPGWRRR